MPSGKPAGAPPAWIATLPFGVVIVTSPGLAPAAAFPASASPPLRPHPASTSSAAPVIHLAFILLLHIIPRRHDEPRAAKRKTGPASCLRRPGGRWSRLEEAERPMAMILALAMQAAATPAPPLLDV